MLSQPPGQPGPRPAEEERPNTSGKRALDTAASAARLTGETSAVAQVSLSAGIALRRLRFLFVVKLIERCM